MSQWQKALWSPAAAARSVAVASGFGVVFLMASLSSAEARGGHGYGRGFASRGMHGAPFPADRRHGNDAYIKAASEERDKLLDTKIKSICRGC